MQARRLLSIASKSTPFSLLALSSFSVSAFTNPRLHNHFTDEEEEGYSPVYRHALKFQRPPTVSLIRHDLQSNSASFIGTVCLPPKIITTRDDKLGVQAILDVKASPESEPTLRILLKMRNNMAEIFLRHSSCNDFIYVVGRLDCYTKPIDNGALRTHCEVKVRELNFVTPRRQDPTCQKSEELQPQKGEAGLEEYKNGLHSWKVFFANPSEWLDARNTKNSSSQPDFIHKDTGKALWQWPNDPPWIEERLQLLDLKMAEHSQDKSPRHPDSRHKDTSETLWLNPDDPPWTKKQLESLDLHMANQGQCEAGLEKYRDDIHLWQVFFASPDDWWDNRRNKRNPRAPDFNHKDTGEALWISPDDPPWIMKQLESLDLHMANQGQGEAGLDKYNEDIHLWQVFFASPDEWWDDRKNKKSPRHPDFVHKDTGEALWINPGDPPWIKKQLESLDLRGAKQDQSEAGLEKYRDDPDLWQVFFASPDEWWNYRKNKKSPRHPDFVHKDTGEALWINPDDPPWIKKQLESLDLQMANQGQGEAGLDKYNENIHLWQVFFTSPDDWWDNRKDKRNPRAPDFKHKDTDEALWQNPDDPPWIKKQLESLDLRREKQGLGEHGGASRSRVSLWEFDQ